MFLRGKGIDYFENSRRATHVQQQYAICNPLEFVGYGQSFWGLTASDGPGLTVRMIEGVERTFFDPVARGAPYGPDDGTIAPWAAVASLFFVPDIACSGNGDKALCDSSLRPKAIINLNSSALPLPPRGFRQLPRDSQRNHCVQIQSGAS